MNTYEISIRTGYADTDQMGFVHHSNYVKFLECARWEAFRLMGLAYKDIEARGTLMPVIDMQLKFMKPAFYDDILRITLKMRLIGSTKLMVNYTILNDSNLLILQARTMLAFVKRTSGKPCRVPEFVKKVVSTSC